VKILPKNKAWLKPSLLLLGAIFAVIIPFLIAAIMIFPQGNNFFKMTVVTMNLLFAGGLLVLFAKYRKVKSNKLYLIGVLAALIIPVGFAFFMVAPLVSTIYSAIYVGLHFIVAIGFLTLWMQRNKIKALF
jgi:peptidoglycan/LPS O-acetylase OafA/YrhL